MSLARSCARKRSSQARFDTGCGRPWLPIRNSPELRTSFLGSLVRNFRHAATSGTACELLDSALHRRADAPRYAPNRDAVREMLNRICQEMRSRVPAHFGELAVRKSDFFRDLAAADYMQFAEQCSDPKHAFLSTSCAGCSTLPFLWSRMRPVTGRSRRHAGPALEQTLACCASGHRTRRDARLRSAVE